MEKPSEKPWEKSNISRKFPYTFRSHLVRTVHEWLDSKQKDDNAEGLWRIHDSLYDLTEFIQMHPGGSFWLEQTKGTDITEAFEAHHVTTLPEELLPNYKIRDASEPRNYTLTFKNDGFYRTLKSRIRDKLTTIDEAPIIRSNLIHSTLLLSTFASAISSVMFESKFFILSTCILLPWTVIASHNYFHQKDNWRMYCFNLSLLSYKDWRISHALSHHIYTNSFYDLELSMLEPFFIYIPNRHFKNWLQRYGSWFYAPIIYGLMFVDQIITRIFYSIFKKNILYLDDFIGLTIPLAMYTAGNSNSLLVLKKWAMIMFGSSFVFSFIGLNAAHHGPKIHHDGDAMREDRDWGLFQLDTVMERSDVQKSQLLTLTHFGNHTLHHLFPTLDHGILPQLYPVLYETMDEFDVKWRECNGLGHFIGQHQQLARIEPYKIPRDKS